ncbi:unnamed protein product [Clonostachys chloroleuca]|uniref:Uncharacterized protein n=1 Tax=Clonostachys chloroleuca TaxID=1926264 RepID=A0AA35MBI2_9HYPO|nr:unnamed protein product [Clonostachys chloroleuca]
MFYRMTSLPVDKPHAMKVIRRMQIIIKTLRSFYMPINPKAMPSRTNLSKMTGCKACGLNYTGAAKVCQCVKRDSQNFHQAGGHQYGTSLGQSAPKRLKVAPDKHGKAPGEQGIP